MARPSCPKGTEDLLPADLPAYTHLFGETGKVMERHGYREIRTPLFENTSLFIRSLGEVTDVVEKEMFTVAKGDTDVSFRPEGTAPVVRAYLQHNLDKIRPFQKFYYQGPMFRYERPQAGRSRQFDQIGIEALGSSSARLDVEVIAVAHRCFEAVGLKNHKLHVNSIGDKDDRAAFREVLTEYMRGVLDDRCEDCHRRFERNVFRMLDCKVKGCQPSNAAAPKFVDHLRTESRERFEEIQELLREIQIPFEYDPSIVRGFDYYTHTVFEVRCPDLGARDAVCGGGRYDNLIEDMGGPSMGAMGFAIGVAPTLLALRNQKHPAMEPVEPSAPVFVAAVSADQRNAAFTLTDQLRMQGVEADTDFEDKSLRGLFKAADKRGVRVMLILGPDEVANGTVQLRDLAAGEDRTVPADDGLADAVRDLLAGS